MFGTGPLPQAQGTLHLAGHSHHYSSAERSLANRDTSWQGEPRIAPTPDMVAAVKMSESSGENVVLCMSRVRAACAPRPAMRSLATGESTFSSLLAKYMAAGASYSIAAERASSEMPRGGRR